MLSNGSPRNPEKEKGSVQFAGGTTQLADKAFEQLKTQAQILLKQTQERKLFFIIIFSYKFYLYTQVPILHLNRRLC